MPSISQGPRAPGTAANDASFGSNAWGSVNSVLTENGAGATVSLPGAGSNSNYLKVTNFGFTIPLNAKITGITVEVRRCAQFTQTAKDTRVRIVKGGVIGSQDKSNGADWPGGGAFAYQSYGGVADLWNETWTPAQINASDFGFVIANTWSGSGGAAFLSVDHIRITVHYLAFSDPGLGF